LAALWVFSGCGSPQVPDDDEAKLNTLLARRFPEVPMSERQRFAADAVAFSRHLETTFSRHGSPYVHNFLVNLGIERKGLCWHYADALYARLKGKYVHLHVHYVGAHIGDFWREHNAVAVTGSDDNLSRAVILDAWRLPGHLYVVPIERDNYRWKHRKERETP
jgi:hypothetical protein